MRLLPLALLLPACTTNVTNIFPAAEVSTNLPDASPISDATEVQAPNRPEDSREAAADLAPAPPHLVESESPETTDPDAMEAETMAPQTSSTEPPDPETIALVDIPPVGTPVAQHGELRVEGTMMLDQNNEPVQLRGISSMWLNTETTGYAYNEQGLRWLRDNWKLQLIRAATPIDSPIGTLLSAESAAKNRKELEVIIRLATKLGIYVLVDLHSHHANAHMEEAVGFFADIAQKYGHLPNVIYEPFNEPLRISWSNELKPYYQRILTTIRQKGSPNIVVLGTPNWSQSVDEASLDPLSEPNVMYTLHFYACEHDTWLRDKADAALARKVALFVTEWGATYADGGVRDKRVCSNVAGEWVDPATGKATPRDMTGDDWHTWMSQAKISWAAWKFDDGLDASALFKPGAPVTGGWGDEWLQGHGPYVRGKLLAP